MDEKISEYYLIPALEHLLASFPFVTGGSTPTTARNTSTGGSPGCWRNCVSSSPSPAPGTATTTECKNGHVVRKLLGHAHIPQRWAGLLNDFHRQHLNPYVNYHRPCLFPQTASVILSLMTP